MQHDQTSRFIPAAGYLAMIASLYVPIAAVIAIGLFAICLFSSSALLRAQAKLQAAIVLILAIYFAIAVVLTKLETLQVLVVIGKVGFIVANLFGLYRLTTAK